MPVVYPHQSNLPFIQIPTSLHNSANESNAISVNVSGKQLLKVEMPLLVKTPVTSNSLPDKVRPLTKNMVQSTKVCDPLITNTNVDFQTKVHTTISNSNISEGISVKYILPSNVPNSVITNVPDSSQIINKLITNKTMPSCDKKPREIASVTNDNANFSPVFGNSDPLHLEVASSSNSSDMINTCSSTLHTPLRMVSSPDHVSSSGTSGTAGHLAIPSLSSMLNSNSNDFSALLQSPILPENSSIGLDDIDTTGNLPMIDISLGGTVTVNNPRERIELPEQLNTFGTEINCEKNNNSANIGSKSSLTNSVVDNLLDITLANSNSNSCFASLLSSVTQSQENSLLQTPSRPLLSPSCISKSNSVSSLNMYTFSNLNCTAQTSPPSSPSHLLKNNDNNWLNNEVNDFSFSSLLGNLETPEKQAFTVKQIDSSVAEQPSTSSNVRNLASVLNENSVDFTAKFAEMKAQKQTSLFDN